MHKLLADENLSRRFVLSLVRGFPTWTLFAPWMPRWPGLLVVNEAAEVSRVLEDTALLLYCMTPSELSRQIVYIPI